MLLNQDSIMGQGSSCSANANGSDMSSDTSGKPQLEKVEGFESTVQVAATPQLSSSRSEESLEKLIPMSTAGNSHCCDQYVSCSCKTSGLPVLYNSLHKPQSSSVCELAMAPLAQISYVVQDDLDGACALPIDSDFGDGSECNSKVMVLPNAVSCNHCCHVCQGLPGKVDLSGDAADKSAKRLTRTSKSRSSKRHRSKSSKSNITAKDASDMTSRKRKFSWALKLCCRQKTKLGGLVDVEAGSSSGASTTCGGCSCSVAVTCHSGRSHDSIAASCSCASIRQRNASGSVARSGWDSDEATTPIIDLSRFNPEAYPIDDWEELAWQERAREMVEGVEPPPGFSSGGHRQSLPVHPYQHGGVQRIDYSTSADSVCGTVQQNAVGAIPLSFNSMWDLQMMVERSMCLGVTSERSFVGTFWGAESRLGFGNVAGDGFTYSEMVSGHLMPSYMVHTQVDYVHCLVPDLLSITNCAFYWGKMDRYEAERLLENRDEGTFLLRDSAQEEYLFSVSFRRYGRSLHARIEQWNHRFSFDSHDPGVFASDTVTGLIEHYKDPSCCMFFEPMLTLPLARSFPFPLQHLCRAVVCSATSYDSINTLGLPKPLKCYLKEYHYKQRVRVRQLD